MSWWPFSGKKKGQADDANEASETPRRKQRQQQASSKASTRQSAPPAKKIPDNLVYGEQLKELKKRGFTNEADLVSKLKIYGGDVNSVLMELELERSQTTSTEPSPQRAANNESTEKPKTEPPRAQPEAKTEVAPATEQEAPSPAISRNLRGCIASQIRQSLLQVSPQECNQAIERMYSKSINGARLYELTQEAISEFGFASEKQFQDILLAAEKMGPTQAQPVSVSATDIDEKSMFAAASEFKPGDAVVSQLGFGKVIEIREDGIVVVNLKGETKGYFAPDALTKTTDYADFSTGDIVRSPMGRSKVLRVRGADRMVVLQTPTGSEGYFHPSALEKLDSKFFLSDQLPKIRSWTAATVREAVSEIYPEAAERLYAKSITGSKLIGLSEEEVLELTGMGNNFDAERWDRVAATLGLVCMKDVETFEQGMAKTGAIGPLAGDLAWSDLKDKQDRVLKKLHALDQQVADLGGKRQLASGKKLKARPSELVSGPPQLVKLGQRQSAQIGRLEDMMVEIDRLTLKPQLFDLRQRQAKAVKKLSGLLSSLPNGIQLVREAQREARKASFNALDDEKALEEDSGDGSMIQLARRQDAVYQRLVDAGRQLQEIASQRGVKLPAFNPQPLPTFDMSMASMEKLIVRERPQQATEEKTSSSTELYNPKGRHGGKRGGDPLGQAVESEAKELDLDTLTIVFKVNKEKEEQRVQMPLSHNQKSVTVGGVRKAIQEFLGDRRIDKLKKGKKGQGLKDNEEFNVGRKRQVQVMVTTE